MARGILPYMVPVGGWVNDGSRRLLRRPSFPARFHVRLGKLYTQDPSPPLPFEDLRVVSAAGAIASTEAFGTTVMSLVIPAQTLRPLIEEA